MHGRAARGKLVPSKSVSLMVRRWILIYALENVFQRFPASWGHNMLAISFLFRADAVVVDDAGAAAAAAA